MVAGVDRGRGGARRARRPSRWTRPRARRSPRRRSGASSASRSAICWRRRATRAAGRQPAGDDLRRRGAARLEARGAGSDQPIERALRLADFPGDAAPRALALAGVEMLAALDPAVRERIQIRQSPAPPPPPAPRAAPPRRRRRGSFVAAVGIAISAVRRDFLGAGNVGRLGRPRRCRSRARAARSCSAIDVEIDGARTTVTLGEASALLVSAGAFGGLRAAGARVAGSLSLGARVGLASLDGTPAGGSGATGGSALRPWWGPALAARGWLRAGAIGFVATLEAGLTARGAHGPRRRGDDPGGRRRLAGRRHRRTILNGGREPIFGRRPPRGHDDEQNLGLA